MPHFMSQWAHAQETFARPIHQRTGSFRRESGLSRAINFLSCGVITCILLCSAPTTVEAADHLDGPAASSDPAADITDVYAWMQNSNKINLVMNVFPLANASSRFSNSVQYVFHVDSQSGYSNVQRRNLLVCTFSVDQSVQCKLNGDSVITATDAGSTSGVTSSDGSFRIFTGLRNDPFFFDLNNFNVVRQTVRDAASSLQFDEAGCPTLDAATQDVLVSALTGKGGLPQSNTPPRDFFGPLNVLSIVVQVDRTLFGPGPLYSVWGSTHRR